MPADMTRVRGAGELYGRSGFGEATNLVGVGSGVGSGANVGGGVWTIVGDGNPVVPVSFPQPVKASAKATTESRAKVRRMSIILCERTNKSVIPLSENSESRL